MKKEGFNLFSMVDTSTMAALESRQMSLAAEEQTTIPPIFVGGLECIHSRGTPGYKGTATALVRPRVHQVLSPYGEELVSRLISIQRILSAVGAADQINRDVELPVKLSKKAAIRRFEMPPGWDMGVSPELLVREALAVQEELVTTIASNGAKMVIEQPYYEVVDFCFSQRPPALTLQADENGNIHLDPHGPEQRAMRRIFADCGDGRLRVPRDGDYTVDMLVKASKMHPFMRVKVENGENGKIAHIKSFKSRRNMRLLPKNVREIDDLRTVRMIVTDYDGSGDNSQVAWELAIPARDNPDPKIRQLVSDEQVLNRGLGFPAFANMRPSWGRIFAENFAGIPAGFGMSRLLTNQVFAMAGEAFRFRLTTLASGAKRYVLPRPDEVLASFEAIWQLVKDQPAHTGWKAGLEKFVAELRTQVPFIRATDRWVRDYLILQAHHLLPDPEPGHRRQLKAGDIPGLQESMTADNFWEIWPLLVNFNHPQVLGWGESVNAWLALLVGIWPVQPEAGLLNPYRFTGEMVEDLFARIDARYMPVEEEVVAADEVIEMPNEEVVAEDEVIEMPAEEVGMMEAMMEVPEIVAAEEEETPVEEPVETPAEEVPVEETPAEEVPVEEVVGEIASPMGNYLQVQALAAEAIAAFGWDWTDTSMEGLTTLQGKVQKAMDRHAQGDSIGKVKALERFDHGMELLTRAIGLMSEEEDMAPAMWDFED